jgi:hypothetical protein
MSTSNPTSIGFFYPFFTSFLMRSPCRALAQGLTLRLLYATVND